MLKRDKIKTIGRFKKLIPIDMIDTTYAAKHFLSPTEAMVKKYQSSPSDTAWREYENEYLKIIQERFEKNQELFDVLARRAMNENVKLGCFCPTRRIPDVYMCHTVIALRFMQEKYPELEVELPVITS